MVSTKKTKPYGLTIACKIATDALYQNIAPASVILSNLLVLQKSDTFPEHLEISYFAVSKKQLSDNETFFIKKLLPEIKRPSFEIIEVLEKEFLNDWVFKKKQKVVTPNAKKTVIKPKKIVSKKTVPIVVIKKNKLS